MYFANQVLVSHVSGYPTSYRNRQCRWRELMVGEISPYHSLTPQKAKEKRTLVISLSMRRPVSASQLLNSD